MAGDMAAADHGERRTGLKSPLGSMLAAVALVAGIAGLDYSTGIEVRIYALYFIPTALAAWNAPRPAALFIPALCTLAWVGSNLPQAGNWSLPVWIVNTTTQAIAFLTIAVLISVLRQRLHNERALSRNDALTGLANSRAFNEIGDKIVAAAARAEQPLTLAYLDLDNFKLVNDRHGHPEGDRVLQEVGAALRAELRVSDIAARMGGDEFALLLPNSDEAGARQLLQRVRSRILKRMQEGDWPVTVSVGAIAYARAPRSLTEAVQRADGLMYTAKHGGKDRVHVESASTA